MTNRNFTNFNEFLNIRYIRRVDSMYMDLSDFYYMIERFKKIYEENTKLEAEIEKLKGELKSEREFRANVRIELLDRKAEIELLRYDLKNEREWITKFKNDYEKLKTEKEQLKNGCDQLKIRLTKKTEIETQLRGIVEQLKSELEQSVKLPCKVGDKAWCITSDQYDYITEPIECTVNEISINIDNPSLLLFRIDSNNSTDGWTDTFPNMRIPNHMNIRRIDDFGKTVFMTREEAEQHLKGQVEE